MRLLNVKAPLLQKGIEALDVVTPLQRFSFYHNVPKMNVQLNILRILRELQ